jgi:hypothetical protein
MAFVEPSKIATSGSRQRGQGRGVSLSTVRSTFAPQCWQNFEPRNIMPKQEGQATVASRAPQCPHAGESLVAGAPHIGQLRVDASMVGHAIPIKASACKPQTGGFRCI